MKTYALEKSLKAFLLIPLMAFLDAVAFGTFLAVKFEFFKVFFISRFTWKQIFLPLGQRGSIFFPPFFLRLVSIYGEPNACFLEVKVPENAISRGGPSDALSYANFKKDEFSYLNITSLGEDLVDHMLECSFACLKTPPCFSFNIEASPNSNNKLLCELLPSDKYNNKDKFNHSDTFHHFSITVSWINKGKLVRSSTAQTANAERRLVLCRLLFRPRWLSV